MRQRKATDDQIIGKLKEKPMFIAEIARQLGYSTNGMKNHLQRLEREGSLSHQRSLQDARQTVYRAVKSDV